MHLGLNGGEFVDRHRPALYSLDTASSSGEDNLILNSTSAQFLSITFNARALLHSGYANSPR